MSNDASLEGQVLIHYRYTLLTVCHLETNIHIMLIFIILGARLRQDEDTDSRQALKLIERQDACTWPPEPLSVAFRCNKLQRIRQALYLKVTEPFEISVEARALSCYQNRMSTPGFACTLWALGFPKTFHGHLQICGHRGSLRITSRPPAGLKFKEDFFGGVGVGRHLYSNQQKKA